MTSIGSKIREETTSLSEKKKINFYETNLVPYLYWVFWSLTWGNEWADDAYVGLNSFYGWTISRKLLKDVCWLKKQLVGCKRLLSRRNKSDRQTETWQGQKINCLCCLSSEKLHQHQNGEMCKNYVGSQIQWKMTEQNGLKRKPFNFRVQNRQPDIEAVIQR